MRTGAKIDELFDNLLPIQQRMHSFICSRIWKKYKLYTDDYRHVCLENFRIRGQRGNECDKTNKTNKTRQHNKQRTT